MKNRPSILDDGDYCLKPPRYLGLNPLTHPTALLHSPSTFDTAGAVVVLKKS